jgi:hypothetical protein
MAFDGYNANLAKTGIVSSQYFRDAELRKSVGPQPGPERSHYRLRCCRLYWNSWWFKAVGKSSAWRIKKLDCRIQVQSSEDNRPSSQWFVNNAKTRQQFRQCCENQSSCLNSKFDGHVLLEYPNNEKRHARHCILLSESIHWCWNFEIGIT